MAWRAVSSADGLAAARARRVGVLGSHVCGSARHRCSPGCAAGPHSVRKRSTEVVHAFADGRAQVARSTDVVQVQRPELHVSFAVFVKRQRFPPATRRASAMAGFGASTATPAGCCIDLFRWAALRSRLHARAHRRSPHIRQWFGERQCFGLALPLAVDMVAQACVGLGGVGRVVVEGGRQGHPDAAPVPAIAPPGRARNQPG